MLGLSGLGLASFLSSCRAACHHWSTKSLLMKLPSKVGLFVLDLHESVTGLTFPSGSRVSYSWQIIERLKYGF